MSVTTTERRATTDDVLDVIESPEYRGCAQIGQVRAVLRDMGLTGFDDAIHAALSRGILRREAGNVYLAHLAR